MAFVNFQTRDESAPSKSYNTALQNNFKLVTSDTPSTQSGPGAIPITQTLCQLTTTGVGDALTLADGVEGQHLYIVHVVDGGSGVITPANLGGYATITMDAVGDSVHLYFSGGSWWIVGQNSIALA